MIDVLSELSSLKKEWNEKFISIYDLMFCIKSENKNVSMSDIAKVLLNRLSDYNIDTLDQQEYPDIFFDTQWAFEYRNEIEAFTYTYGIPCFVMGDNHKAKSIAYKEWNLFFIFYFFV